MAGFSRLIFMTLLASIFLFFGCDRSGTAGVENNTKTERKSEPVTVYFGAKDLYITRCAVCHGDSGKGDGPAAASFPNKPANFTDKKFMSGISDTDLTLKITKGKPLSGMPSWESILSADEIQALVKYLRNFSK